MSQAYWVSSYRAIYDPEKLAAYAALAGLRFRRRVASF